ncbi:MAG: SCO family protein [Wenzhouxiangellaceae bacterium]
MFYRSSNADSLTILPSFPAWVSLVLIAMLTGATAAEPVKTARPGERAHQAVYTDQTGREVRFSEVIHERRVALQFIFTSCGTICPPMGAQFGALQKLLAQRSIGDVHLVSVSIDPARDTPDKLAEWAGRFGHDGERWTLLTGPGPNIDLLLQALGMGTGDKTAHPAVVLLNDGRGGDWQPVDALSRPADVLAALDKLEPYQESPAGESP